MMTSLQAWRAGINSVRTSFDDVVFCRLSDARTRALTPASANVCNEAPRCLSFLLICRDLQALCWDRKRGPERATHDASKESYPIDGPFTPRWPLAVPFRRAFCAVRRRFADRYGCRFRTRSSHAPPFDLASSARYRLTS